MIELRWVQRWAGIPSVGEEEHIEVERVLQYRTRIVDKLEHYQPHWTNWQDVPTVKEQP